MTTSDQPRTSDGRYAVKHGTPPDTAVIARTEGQTVPEPGSAAEWSDVAIEEVNAPYDALRPPYPRSAAQIIDFWMTAKIPDEDIMKARAMLPDRTHTSLAEIGLRCTMAYRDSVLFERWTQREDLVIEISAVRSHLVELPAGHWMDVEGVTNAVKGHPIVEYGLDDALIRHQAEQAANTGAANVKLDPGDLQYLVDELTRDRVSTVAIHPDDLAYIAEETAMQNALWNANPHAEKKQEKRDRETRKRKR